MSRIYERIRYYRDKTPEKKAFTFRTGDHYESIDYAALYDQVNILSEGLAGYKGKTIAVIGNNKLEYALSLLAVLCRVGNTFLIDKELSSEDILKIFEQKKPELIILDEELGLSFDGYRVLTFNEIGAMLKGSRNAKAEEPGSADASFAGRLILHTSGTTGEPKCVSLSEENYYGVIPELNRKWKVVAEHSCLFIIPLYHIYALTSLFHGLYAGINNILEWDFKRLGTVLAETKPCLFMGVPLMYNRIMNALPRDSIPAYFGGNYVFGVTAGSLMPYETAAFFNGLGLPVYNVYGMTETSGPIAINYRDHNRYESVGEILDINEVVIKDPDEDGTGRICVKGSNVFDGYLNDDESIADDGFFDTGDIGYIKEGYLYVTGRKKNLIVGSNGKNISPEELNRKLMLCGNIDDCNVIMENDRLTAVVNTVMSEEELKACIDELNKNLPAYKRISGFRITDKNIK